MALLKHGQEAQQALAKEESKSSGGDYIPRFWMPEGSEKRITFLDAELDSDGLFKNGIYYEHTVYLNGSWNNHYYCVADDEPCPLCEEDNKKYLVSPLLVIDHSEWTDSQGKVHANEIKLFPAKSATVPILQKLAEKRDGSLVGAVFDVSRQGDKSANVGNLFDFVGKYPLQEILKRVGLPFELPDVEDFIRHLPADKLIQEGIAKGSGMAYTQPQQQQNPQNQQQPSNELAWDDDIPF